ncbi:hypothetical protein, partial [Weissella confusa]|uniref:hypothetical protein n=1 Tax=Weissella confusa TaxID=1583 RepID=UPI001A7EE4DA
ATSCLLLFPEKYSRIASSFVCFDILVIKKNPESYFNFRGTPHSHLVAFLFAVKRLIKIKLENSVDIIILIRYS